MFELEELKQKSLAVKLGTLPVYREEDVKAVRSYRVPGEIGHHFDLLNRRSRIVTGGTC